MGLLPFIRERKTGKTMKLMPEGYYAPVGASEGDFTDVENVQEAFQQGARNEVEPLYQPLKQDIEDYSTIRLKRLQEGLGQQFTNKGTLRGGQYNAEMAAGARDVSRDTAKELANLRLQQLRDTSQVSGRYQEEQLRGEQFASQKQQAEEERQNRIADRAMELATQKLKLASDMDEGTSVDIPGLGAISGIKKPVQKERKTQVVDFDNREFLIDSQTGETIRELGGKSYKGTSGDENTKDNETKTIQKFYDELANPKSKIAIRGEEREAGGGYITREAFINYLQRKYPDVDANDIAKAVWDYYRD